MAPYSHLLVRLCVFMVVFCVFVFLYIVCVFVLVCVSLRESLTCDLSSCSSEAPPNSHLGREKWNWGEREDANRCSGEFPGKTSCLQPPPHINLTHVKSLWQEREQTHLAIS